VLGDNKIERGKLVNVVVRTTTLWGFADDVPPGLLVTLVLGLGVWVRVKGTHGLDGRERIYSGN
jgi:hypothetical protein